MPTNRQAALIPAEHIAHSILILRGQRVLLDSELAALYGVPTKRFNEQVKRNVARFPADFMFRLSTDEASALRSQFATLKAGRGRHRKYLSYAFNEHGAIMAATILLRDRIHGRNPAGRPFFSTPCTPVIPLEFFSVSLYSM